MNFYSTLFLIIGISSHSVQAKNIDDKAKKMNELSMKSYGISINALSYLRNTSINSYIPILAINYNNNISIIYELEDAGFIKIESDYGLPDSTEDRNIFVNIIPTKSGIEVKNSLEFLIGDDISDCDLKSEQEKLIKKLRKKIKENSTDNIETEVKDELKNLDMNSDGIQDIFYEDYLNYYYVLSDRNFDGEADEKWEYSLNDELLSGSGDNDFDGVYETSYKVKNGIINQEYIDSNKNGIYDIYSHYEHGVWKYSEKYHASDNLKISAKIERYNHKLSSISSDKIVTETNLSEMEFQQRVIK